MSPTTKAHARLLAADVSAVTGESQRADDGASISDIPLAQRGGVHVGVWEMTPGTDHDTEADEFFLVLSGTGTVTFDDESAIELRPGVLVSLAAGDSTTWVIRETLRKLYVVLPEATPERQGMTDAARKESSAQAVRHA